MELSATYQKISELQERLDILSVHLELAEKQDRLEEVHRELENSEIWTNPDKAQSLGKEKVQLENIVMPLHMHRVFFMMLKSF